MSILTRQADLAHVLADCGVVVTLGAASTFGTVRSADREVLNSDGIPVALVSRSIIVLVAQDTLPGLASGAEIVVADGPRADTYQVDRILGGADGAFVRFLAYPTTAAAAPAFWVRGEIVLPWALREAGAAAGPVFDLSTLEGGPILVLESETTEGGTDSALNVVVFACATEGGIFEDSGYAFDEIDASGGFRALALDLGEIERYIQLAPVVTGTDAPAFRCGAGALAFSVPR